MSSATIDLALLDLLHAVRPSWSKKELYAAQRKLAKINVETQLDLLLEFKNQPPDALNVKLKVAGEKSFSQETLLALRDGAAAFVRAPRQWTQDRPVRVICMGDSQTKQGYPTFLRRMLKSVPCPGNTSGWEVLNLGVNGTVATKFPSTQVLQSSYHNIRTYIDALEANADFAVICFGSNDARKEYWDEKQFIIGLCSMIGSLLTSSEEPPLIFLMTPPPLYREGMNIGCKQSVLNVDLPYRILPRIARELNVGLVDSFSALGGPDLSGFKLMQWDCVHPNDDGHQLVAAAVRDALVDCVDTGRLSRSVPRAPALNLPKF